MRAIAGVAFARVCFVPMKALVERVECASVTSDGVESGRIGRGLLVYVGVVEGDRPRDATFIAEKVRWLRIFPDDAGKMNRDVAEAGGSVLVISAFSLAADARKGRRPTFDAAARPEESEPLYELVLEQLRRTGIAVACGRFRTTMKVTAVNDGPICIPLDSRTAS